MSCSYFEGGLKPLSLNKGDRIIVIKPFYVSPSDIAAIKKKHHDLEYYVVSVGSILKVSKFVEKGSYTNGYFYTVYGKILNGYESEIYLNSILTDNWGNEYADPYVKVYKK